MKVAVLGAGVSGLTVAKLLQAKGNQVIVFEKNETPGGLARTRVVDDYLYDPHGGHIFNSKDPEVVNWVFSILPKENWQYTARNAKIYFNGKYISYPFELSLSELDTEDAVSCIYDFILSQQGKEPDNFKDWLTWNFGKGIADYYMIPYNEKIWAYPLEKMETQWMRGKMPLPEKKEIIRSLLLKDPTERKMPHSTFYYPIHGGIQTMINAIADGLDVHCGSPVYKLKKDVRKWFVNGEDSFDMVISTIPLPLLPQVMELPSKVINYIRDLKYNGLTTIFFDCPKTDISWLYIPSHDFRSHRVCYQSSFTPYANPNPNRGCGALEVIGKQFEITPNIVQDSTILPSDLDFRQVIDCEFTEYAYVIHDVNYRKNIGSILDYFEGDNSFKLLGRWGTWNYKNMDMCMRDAINLVETISELE